MPILIERLQENVALCRYTLYLLISERIRPGPYLLRIQEGIDPRIRIVFQILNGDHSYRFLGNKLTNVVIIERVSKVLHTGKGFSTMNENS